MATRNYWNQPGTNKCFWNIPIGSGAIWGAATDADTIDARNGGFVNTYDNYGAVVWVSLSGSDPTFTFSGHGADYDSATSNGQGTPITVTAHCVAGSYAAGPYVNGVDQQYVFVDTTGHPGYYYHFAPLVITDLQAGQGPFGSVTGNYGAGEDATTDTFCTDWETKKANGIQAAGVIRQYDLDPTQNLARLPGSTTITAIQHVLRYSIGTQHYKANANPANADYPNGPLLGTSWPQYYQDWQSGSQVYTGNLIYGTLLGIPSTVTMPTGLTTAGQQLFWTLQNYGALSRDANNGGFTLYVDQNVSASWANDASSDLANHLVPLLCPLRNQHVGGSTDFSNVNGPGTRLDSGPPALAALTTTTFTPSANDTTVSAGSTALITDASGNTWGISSGGLVVLNGVADTTTANVVELAYVSGEVWQETSTGLWYGKTSTTASWAPTAGTTTNPVTGAISTPTGSLPAAPVIAIGAISTVSIQLSWTSSGSGQIASTQTVLTAGSTAYITDAAGNQWNLTSGGQVSFNSAVLPETSGMTELTYVSSVVWGLNTAGNWYSYGLNSSGAAATTGGPTTTSPLSASPNDTVTTTVGPAIVDTNLNVWTLTSGAQIAYNGVVVGETSGMTELAYVGGVVSGLNTAALWYTYGATAGIAATTGGPTATSPLTPVSYQVNYRVTGSVAWTAFGSPVTTLTTLVTGLTQSVSYDFEVVATNGAGSTSSTIATASTASSGPGPVTTGAPSAPTGLTVTSITPTNVTVSWTASTGTAPITYQPQYRLHQATVTQATITGVTLSANTGKAGASAGTVIGTLTAQSTGVALAGVAFAVSTQSTAGAFQIVGTSLEVLSAGLAAGTYSVTVSVSGSNATNSPQSYALSITISAATTTSDFTVKGGKIYDPGGNLYVPKGVNATDAFSLALFPGCTHVRYPVYPSNPGTSSAVYPAPSTFLSYAEQLTGYTLSGTTWTKTGTGTPVVLEIEDHNQNTTNGTYDALPPNTGQALAVQVAWYTQMAAYFAGNPYVWLGGPNEINSSDGSYLSAAIGAISTYELAIYNAIRAGSTTKMIQLMAGVGGSNIGTVGAGGGFIASDYAAMKNIVWEIHCYYSDGDSEAYGDYTTAAGYVQGGTSSKWPGTTGGWGISGAQSIQSADGVVPVIIGEWGPSSGSTTGSDADQLTAEIIAVQAQGVGATAWCYANGGIGTDWELTNTAGTALTGWGSQVVKTL